MVQGDSDLHFPFHHFPEKMSPGRCENHAGFAITKAPRNRIAITNDTKQSKRFTGLEDMVAEAGLPEPIHRAKRPLPKRPLHRPGPQTALPWRSL